MSTQPQQYEGSALEPLLERIHREHGPRVKIVRAERVREGGVLGFFAREMFRLTVDAKAAPRPQERQRYDATRKPARSMNAARAKPGKPASQEQAGAQRSPAARTSSQIEGRLAPRRLDPPDSTAQGPPASSVLADTLAMDDMLDISTPPASTAAGPATIAQPASTPAIQPGFAEVLAHVAHDMDTDMDTDTLSDMEEDALPDGDLTEEIVFEDVADSYVLEDSAGRAELGSGPGWPGSQPSGHEAANNVAFQALDGADAALTTNHHIASSRPLLPAMLVKAGIPEQLLDSHEVAELNGAYDPTRIAKTLVDTFARLPSAPPPPALPGSLLAIVGDLQKSRRLAAEIATELGLDPVAVPVASPRPVGKIPMSLTARSALEVAERAPGWRRNGSATVVVVVSPLVGGNRSWARLVLAAMKPTAVWGIAEALYKTEEITAWAEALGGVDALVLSEVRHSISPASATATGIPIARLDEGRASPERWATVVGDLLGKTFAAAHGESQRS
ncbi:MAG: hypothetical protein ACYDGY_02640 [Acidimicrobiales bacterium]